MRTPLISMSPQERAILSQYIALRRQYHAAPDEQKPQVEELITLIFCKKDLIKSIIYSILKLNEV